ncbi:MAG: type II secretion system protein M [Gammaproteobacteria bacterium]|nr:type II secretion system protein M [Gammaproteobacteria bacterium]
MKEWWTTLGTRERLILGGGALLLVPLLLWALVWQPLASGVHTLETDVAAQREALQWMRNAAAELQQLRGSSAQSSAGLGGRSLLAVVDQSARAAGLGNGLKRIEPDSATAVRARLEGVAFDAVVKWLDELSRQFGVLATLVTVERTPGTGQVNVRLTLQSPES